MPPARGTVLRLKGPRKSESLPTLVVVADAMPPVVVVIDEKGTVHQLDVTALDTYSEVDVEEASRLRKHFWASFSSTKPDGQTPWCRGCGRVRGKSHTDDCPLAQLVRQQFGPEKVIDFEV